MTVYFLGGTMKVKGTLIKVPEDVVSLLKRYANKRQEHFLTLAISSAQEAIRIHCITKGLVNKTLIHPRECFYPAIIDNAVAVIFIHNHPSNNINPSNADNNIAANLMKAGKILGIRVLDFIVIGKNDYLSFRKDEKLKTLWENNNVRYKRYRNNRQAVQTGKKGERLEY